MNLSLHVLPTGALSEQQKHAVIDLCTRAFKEDFSSLFRFVQSADHVLAYHGDRLVGHATWSTRRLQPGEYSPLRTFYLDAVVAEPELWGLGEVAGPAGRAHGGGDRAHAG